MTRVRALPGWPWAIVAVCATFPFWLPSYYLHLSVLVGIFIMLSASLNLIGGYAGFMSLGHAAFWGVGAYTSAQVALMLGSSAWTGMVVAFALTALVGLLLAVPCLRLSGIYLTMVTIAFAVIAHLLFVNLTSVTGGSVGLSDIPRPALFGNALTGRDEYFYVVLVVVTGTLVLIRAFLHSGYGQAVVAARDDDLAASCTGVNTVRNKVLSFALSSGCAGLAGALYAHYVTYINPDSFTVEASIRILVMVVVGGLASLAGSVVGAVVVYLLPEVLRFLDEVYLVIYALLIIGIMLFLPEGLASLPRRLSTAWSIRRRST